MSLGLDEFISKLITTETSMREQVFLDYINNDVNHKDLITYLSELWYFYFLKELNSEVKFDKNINEMLDLLKNQKKMLINKLLKTIAVVTTKNEIKQSRNNLWFIDNKETQYDIDRLIKNLIAINFIDNNKDLFFSKLNEIIKNVSEFFKLPIHYSVHLSRKDNFLAYFSTDSNNTIFVNYPFLRMYSLFFGSFFDEKSLKWNTNQEDYDNQLIDIALILAHEVTHYYIEDKLPGYSKTAVDILINIQSMETFGNFSVIDLPSEAILLTNYIDTYFKFISSNCTDKSINELDPHKSKYSFITKYKNIDNLNELIKNVPDNTLRKDVNDFSEIKFFDKLSKNDINFITQLPYRLIVNLTNQFYISKMTLEKYSTLGEFLFTLFYFKQKTNSFDKIIKLLKDRINYIRERDNKLKKEFKFKSLRNVFLRLKEKPKDYSTYRILSYWKIDNIEELLKNNKDMLSVLTSNYLSTDDVITDLKNEFKELQTKYSNIIKSLNH